MFWRQKQKMDWMLAVIRSVPPPAPLDQAWKFKGDLSEVPLTEQEFEAALARATDAARESVAPDADVRFLYVDFWLGSMVFDGYSPSTRKGFSMTVRPSGLSVHHIERDRSSFIFTAAMQAPWRSDPSWTRLITASWLRERPFEGHITLHAPGFDGSTAWRIEYHEIDEGLSISGGRRTYRFEAGELIVT